MRDKPPGLPVHFYSLESLNPMSMRGVWDIVLARGLEAEVVDDMRLFEPELDSMHFLTGVGSESGILVGLRGGGHRLPIDSYGDGMRRLLALRLSFVGSANGFLLIDEIDTGLHWTVMEDITLTDQTMSTSSITSFSGMGSTVRLVVTDAHSANSPGMSPKSRRPATRTRCLRQFDRIEAELRLAFAVCSVMTDGDNPAA